MSRWDRVGSFLFHLLWWSPLLLVILAGAAGAIKGYRMNVACAEHGGVPTRDYQCLKPEALLPKKGGKP